MPLISSSEIDRRAAQHRNVIAAAQRVKIKLFVYMTKAYGEVSPQAFDYFIVSL